MKGRKEFRRFWSFALVVLMVMALTITAFAKYDPDKDYSRELARDDLSSSERAQLESEREEKINDKYGGVEPPMYGSNEKFSDYYDDDDDDGDRSYHGPVNMNTSDMQFNAIVAAHTAGKNGTLTADEANDVIHSIQESGLSNPGSISENSEVVSSMLKALGVDDNPQNRAEAVAVMTNDYTKGTTNITQTYSNLVDNQGNAMYFEAGKVYMKVGDDWVVNPQYPPTAGALDLDQDTLKQIMEIKEAYANAPDLAAKNKLHADAEDVRNKAGYSGGLDGSFFSPSGGNGGTGSSRDTDDYDYDPRDPNPNPDPTPTDPNEPMKFVVYTVTASAGEHGSITPAGVKKTLQGTTISYSVTPATGYLVKEIVVDGVPVSSKSSYTFFNINADHNIHVNFKSKMQINDITTGAVDASGRPISNSTKSGYGIGCSVTVDAENAIITSVTARNSATGKIYTLQEVNGKYILPVNRNSVTGARVDYLPANTPDGEYKWEVKVTAQNVDDPNEVITKDSVVKYTIKGVMYEDDFTGDRH